MNLRRERRLEALAVVAPALLGVVVGVAWWALAPTSTVIELGDHTLVSTRAPEFAAAQAGALALLGAGAGVLSGVIAARWLLRSGRAPVRRSLAVVLASAAGSVVAAGIGHVLGPASVADQRSAHPKAALVSPLSIHSPTVLLVWPALAALALAVVHLAAARRQAGDDQLSELPEGPSPHP